MGLLSQTLHLAWAKMTHATLCVHSNCWDYWVYKGVFGANRHLSRENRMSQGTDLASSFFFFFLCGPFTYWSEAKLATAPCFCKCKSSGVGGGEMGRKVVKKLPVISKVRLGMQDTLWLASTLLCVTCVQAGKSLILRLLITRKVIVPFFTFSFIIPLQDDGC